MKQTLFIIDAYNLIYRMFYAIPEMHTREGMQVNAIFGVAKFLKSLSEENPDALLVVATDLGSSFRNEIFSDYKATRDRMPDNLRSQIDGVFLLFKTANIQIIGKEGFEADDVMGTLAATIPDDKRQVVIISSDKDLCQFVDDGNVHIYDAMKRKFMRRNDVIEKFGVPPEQVRDYLAIVGDSSDNIPWLAGFWPKKTADLLMKYSSLENIFENLDDYTPKMRESLEKGKEKAFLSQKLATIITDLEIEKISEENFSEKLKNPEYIELLQKYEFKSLIPKEFQIIIPKEEIFSENIETFEKFEKILTEIKKSQKPIGLEIDNYNKIFISFSQKVFEIDSKKVDITHFIDEIFSGKIHISVYDLKEIFQKLDNIRTPIRNNILQESLF